MRKFGQNGAQITAEKPGFSKYREKSRKVEKNRPVSTVLSSNLAFFSKTRLFGRDFGVKNRQFFKKNVFFFKISSKKIEKKCLFPG